MDKRYQVFLSSTYADLKDERRAVIQALMEMDCIPAGMELFPSTDDEQFSFIKKVIDDCDYYVLIIGGRYGSTTPEGLSYTEQEYDYARGKGIPVLAFVHEHPAKITVEKSDIEEGLRLKLAAFREKVMSGRLVKLWNDPKELPGMVALSLSKATKTHPAVGWVRANKVASADLLADLNEVRKKNEYLEVKVGQLLAESELSVPNIAGLEDQFGITGSNKAYAGSRRSDWTLTLTWAEIFAALGPYIMQCPNDTLMHSYFNSVVQRLFDERKREPVNDFVINENDFQTVKIQLMALKLAAVNMEVTVQGGQMLFWKLTDKGERTLVELRAVRKKA